MKKISITFVIVAVLSLMAGKAYAQDVDTLKVRDLLKTTKKKWGMVENYAPKPEKKPKVKTPFDRPVGYVLRPEVGGGLYLERDIYGNITAPAYGAYAALNVNYQFNTFLSAGVGVGYQWAQGQYKYHFFKNNGDANSVTAMEITNLIYSVPVYANARLYLTDTKVQPFFDAKLGFNIGLNRQLFDIDRIYQIYATPATNGNGDAGITDTWIQYDDYAKIGGFHGGLAFGLSIRNFALSMAVDWVTWVYHSEKTNHVEFRQNSIPQWEYEKEWAKSNVVTPISESDNIRDRRAMVSLKLDYSFPLKKK